jgi:putative transposase
MPREMRELIEGMALRRPPPRMAEVYRAVGRIAEDRGWQAPSYTVVRRVIVGLDRSLVALAHHGPDDYRDRYELVLWRESVHPNDVWQADHTQLDVVI